MLQSQVESQRKPRAFKLPSLIVLVVIIIAIVTMMVTEKKETAQSPAPIASEQNNPSNETVITGDQAIAEVKKKHSGYEDYPSNNLPPKRIEVIGTPEGFRVGMYVEGSGVAGILKANCFFVTKTGIVNEVGMFQGEGPATSINLTTCVPQD